MKKILLAVPPTGIFVREDRCQSAVEDFAVYFVRPPLDLMLMAGACRGPEVICRIRDYPMERLDFSACEQDLRTFLPDILVISVTDSTKAADMELAKMAKAVRPDCLTLAKGAEFLIQDEEMLAAFPQLDMVVRGECEFSLRDLLQTGPENTLGLTWRQTGRVVRNPDRPRLEDLDCLPLPARDLVRNELYQRPDTGEPMTVVETNRGCPSQCIFCLVGHVAGSRIRSRSPRAVAEEIALCQREFGLSNFHFKSDTFTWNREWVLAFCQELKQRALDIRWICNSRVNTLDEERVQAMAAAGCFAIGLGVESGDPEILKRIKKGITREQALAAVRLCRRYGIKTYAYFIIGFPWDTEASIRTTLRFTRELGSDFMDIFLPYPFPGTELHRMVQELGLLDTGPKSQRAYAEGVTPTQTVSVERLQALRRRGLLAYYLRPGYLLRQLVSAGSGRVLWNYVKYGLRLLTRLFPARRHA